MTDSPDARAEPPTPAASPPAQPFRVLVSGASGLVGTQVCGHLSRAGHRVGRLVRRPPVPGGDEIRWDPDAGTIDPERLAGFDVVVHLSGENIARRWTNHAKRRLRDSRVGSTRLLSESLTGLDRRPATMICASAIGYYGNRGDELLTEASSAGYGFLPDLCQDWEQAADAARAAGIRVVHLRIGVVLSAAGGALAKMLLPFRLGLAGVVGSGRQWMSWIAMADLVRVVECLMAVDGIAGPVNAVTPNPVTNREFTKTLGAVLHRPTILPLPGAIARVALGEMAEETLLASARVLPSRLNAAGFTFRYPSLRDALQHELTRTGRHGDQA